MTITSSYILHIEDDHVLDRGGNFMSEIRKVGAVIAMAAALSLAFQPTASANMWGEIKDKKAGAESPKWFDEKYSEVEFYNCNSAHHQSVQVLLRHALDFQPDPNMGTKVYTACFKSGGVSRGSWNDLTSGDYYFELGKIDSGDSNTIDVDKFYVDTTLAD
ncbi:hypothetical protein [Streptomyces sp. WAC04114]|uniref:hypothetical protein n=1 Tax=Streptomyces sp. WAC04114 TaxID=2867961 RepID=UPI001C8C9511|nr:hypothetical protein [Streptomyces sp. WAC04114]MBX9361886.1 hypothetical protein [Streptomyces sp. WAC04114]